MANGKDTMAALIKFLIVGKTSTARYTPLQASDSSASKRGPSTDAGIDMSDSFVDEKRASTDAHPLSARINPRIISDATIGLSDGLTVPFALTAGLSALGDTNVVIYGGLAELIAGGISMVSG